MWQGFATLFEDNLEFLGGEARVLDLLERRIAAKHLEIEMLPAATHSCKLRLALFDREKLHNYFKKWVVHSTPIIF